MVSAELWLSFASVIRAYAAASAVNADLAPEVTVADDAILIDAGAARLEVRCDPRTGGGTWQLQRDGAITIQGEFALRPEGRIALHEKTLDLDHAAIDLVASVMNAAAARNER